MVGTCVLTEGAKTFLVVSVVCVTQDMCWDETTNVLVNKPFYIELGKLAWDGIEWGPGLDAEGGIPTVPLEYRIVS